MTRPRRGCCRCRTCLAETLRRAQRQYHAGRPDVGALMVWRVVEALESGAQQQVCLETIRGLNAALDRATTERMAANLRAARADVEKWRRADDE